MPTTTKMGIVYPSSTDLVKDGATNMGTIATTVDAKTGLVFLNTATFSAVSSQSITSIFSSSFDNYKVIIDFVASTSTVLNLRLRTTSDDTNSLYQRQYATFSGTTAAYARTANDNTWAIQLIDTPRNNYHIEIGNPNLATQTSMFCFANRAYNNSASNDMLFNFGGHNSTTQFTGFTIYPSAGTITGTVSVYGYND